MIFIHFQYNFKKSKHLWKTDIIPKLSKKLETKMNLVPVIKDSNNIANTIITT